MTTEDTLLDISSEVSSGEEFLVEEAPLLVFRVVGCTFVTILVGFTIIIYVTSGMTHTDCLAQIYAEFCILSAYMLILLTTTEPSKINKNMCITISFFLHICFVGAFFFSFLEVLCIAQVLIPSIQKRIFLKSMHVSLIGWALPLIIASLSVLIWLKDFAKKSNCWVDMHKPLFWPTVIPIGICISLQVILLLMVFFSSDVPEYVPESQYKRAKCFFSTRWASGIILIILTVAWSSGLLAYNRKQDNLYAAFTVSSILLGVCIFTLRISTDDEIRAVIIADLLCCLVQPNKVTTVPAQKALPSKKKSMMAESQNRIMNGKIMEIGSNSVISHR